MNDDDPSPIAKTVVGVVALILFAVIFSVVSSHLKDARVHARQAYFEQTYREIQETDRSLDQLAKTPGDRYQSTVATCQRLVRAYNTRARETVFSEFTDPNLPARIDSFAPATDCQATRQGTL